MSDRIVTGLRLLRAVWEAQRTVDQIERRIELYSDASWKAARDAVDAAKQALAEFETATAEDWKTRQAGS